MRFRSVGLGRLKSHHGTDGKVEIVQTPGLPIYISGLGSKREITDVVVRDQRYTIAFLVVVGKALRVVIIGEQLANLKVGLPDGSSERLDASASGNAQPIAVQMLCPHSLFIFILLIDERGRTTFHRFPMRKTSTTIALTLCHA